MVKVPASVSVRDPGNTLQTAQRINISSAPSTLRNAIGGRDLSDMYRFRLSGRSRMSAVLEGLRANADLALWSNRGKLIGRSRLAGTRTEKLDRTLEAGIYFLQVVGRPGQRTNYQLRLSATSGNPSGNPIVSPPVVNTAPQFSANPSITLTKGTEIVLTQNQLLAIDREQSSDRLIYTVTNLPTNGRLLLNDTILRSGDRFTQADINTGKVKYKSFIAPQIIQGNVQGITNLQISGSNLIWTEQADNQFKLWFADADAATVQPVQIWAGASNPVARLSGADVVFQAQPSGETDTEIFLSKPGDRTKTNLQDRAIAITANDLDDRNPRIAGNHITWETADPGDRNTPNNLTDDRLLLYRFDGTQTTEITQTNRARIDRDTFAAEIDGTDATGYRIVWQMPTPAGSQIQGYDITNQRLVAVSPDDSLLNQNPQISGNRVIWNRFTFATAPGGTPTLNSEVFLNQNNQISNISDDPRNDVIPTISGGNGAWTNADTSGTNIFYYNGTKTQVTSQMRTFSGLRLSGNNLVWSGTYGPGDTELYFYDGTQVRQMTNNPAEDTQLALDGDRLAWFSSSSSGVGAIYVGRLSNGEFAFFDDEGNPQDQFSFTLTDGVGGTITGSVPIKLTV